MHSPYGLNLIESCLTCRLRENSIFCGLPDSVLHEFEKIKYTTGYPANAVLFVEGQSPRGVFVLCKGRVKLSFSSNDGKTLIFKVAEPVEILGLGATLSGKPYDLTAETIGPCQITFVKREDFLRLLKAQNEACFRVAEQLSHKYNDACHEMRSLGLSHSAGEKLAKLLLEWSSRNGQHNGQVNLHLTHEEMAQMIGTSRETVSRLLADMKNHQIIEYHGAMLLIRNKPALRVIAGA
ncbi:MAG TPA: Crp/Fnr family transcriptional regulator [Terriglobales bacterium]|nr:Crp/Fnr family transcriptional regulator [Terriglobales bacterium]